MTSGFPSYITSHTMGNNMLKQSSTTPKITYILVEFIYTHLYALKNSYLHERMLTNFEQILPHSSN